MKGKKIMKYNTINELDARIERIIKKTVKHYYTDWKNYDRPKYMALKGSTDKKDKTAILIVRECGTYLLTNDSIDYNVSANTLYNYYQTQERADYYMIDLERLTITKYEPHEAKLKERENVA